MTRSAIDTVGRFLGLKPLLPAAMLALLIIPGAFAQEQRGSMAGLTSEEEIRQFCTNIAEPARDRRYLLQKQELEKLQADVDARIAVLENRRAEYEDWLKRRNDFLKRAENGLVEIYRTMKPDAAAPQLEEIKVDVAAAIIMKLPPRQSGLILSEMSPDRAAKVAAIITSASDANTSKDPS